MWISRNCLGNEANGGRKALDDVFLVIHKAFDQNRVDLDIITPEDLEEDDFEEDEELD